MYIGLEVQTEETIKAGKAELCRFKALIQVPCASYLVHYNYSHCFLQKHSMKSNSGKNWNFPKIHMIEHAFDDIEAKGATRNYNTKPNEKLHGPLKKAYAW